LNPDWKTGIAIEYYFEKVQTVSFKVADSDGSDEKEKIGKAKVTLG
jgi:hypothetical protein